MLRMVSDPACYSLPHIYRLCSLLKTCLDSMCKLNSVYAVCSNNYNYMYAWWLLSKIVLRAAPCVHEYPSGVRGPHTAVGTLPLGELSGAHYIPARHPGRFCLEWGRVLFPGMVLAAIYSWEVPSAALLSELSNKWTSEIVNMSVVEQWQDLIYWISITAPEPEAMTFKCCTHIAFHQSYPEQYNTGHGADSAFVRIQIFARRYLESLEQDAKSRTPVSSSPHPKSNWSHKDVIGLGCVGLIIVSPQLCILSLPGSVGASFSWERVKNCSTVLGSE